jgi:hypothetical protein
MHAGWALPVEERPVVPGRRAHPLRLRRPGPAGVHLISARADLMVARASPVMPSRAQCSTVVRVLFVTKSRVAVETRRSLRSWERSVNPSRKLPRFESWICHQMGENGP